MLALYGCDGGCEHNSDCAAGSFCSEGVCATQCTSDAECASGELCSPFGQCVVNAVCTGADGDRDGYCAGAEADCDDTDPTVHPGAREVCTSALSAPRDENCDGIVDDGCPFYFGVPHPIVPVHTSTGNHFYPRLSADGLQMRFGAPPAGGGQLAIHRATRPDLASPFGRSEIDPDFAGWVGDFSVQSIRFDGLEVYVQNGGTQTVRGTRLTTSEPFGAPEPAFSNARHPFLSPDGLELYVEDLSVSPSIVSRSTRTSIDQPFGTPVSLQLTGTSSRDYAPFLTPDGSTLLFFRVPVAGRRRLFAATRPARDAPFERPFELANFEDEYVEGPFYVPATRELFYSTASGGLAGWSIFRVQVCRDGPCDSPEIACPSGVRSADRLHCYTRFSTARTYTDAEADCVLQGGHLASIHTADEAAIVDDVGTSELFWIGATDAASEGAFVWSSGEPMLHTFWASTQPSDTMATENCLHGPGGWDDADCAVALAYVCETEVWPTW
jgi:hypothetical protein